MCARVWSICNKLKINTWYGEAAIQLPGLVGILCVPYIVLGAVKLATSRIDERRATCDLASSVCKFVCSWLQFCLNFYDFTSVQLQIHCILLRSVFFFQFFDWLHAPFYKWSSGTVNYQKLWHLYHINFYIILTSWNYQKSPLWLFGCYFVLSTSCAVSIYYIIHPFPVLG